MGSSFCLYFRKILHSPKNLTPDVRFFGNVRFLEIRPPGLKRCEMPVGCGWAGSGTQFPALLKPIFHDAAHRRLAETDFRKILHSSKNLTFLEKSYTGCKIFLDLQSCEMGEIVENPSLKI